MSWAFQGQRSYGEGLTPLGIGVLSWLWWIVLLFPGKNALPCSSLGIHLVGSLAPWRSKLIISPCVPIQHGTCPLGMILHIHKYALHGIISHRDHSMSITSNHQYLLNMCIKPLYPGLVLKDIIKVYNTSLGKVTRRPIGLEYTGKGLFLERIKSKSCR
jgi:hypothetical protein